LYFLLFGMSKSDLLQFCFTHHRIPLCFTILTPTFAPVLVKHLDVTAVKPNSKVEEGGNQHKSRHHIEESGPHEVGVIEEAVSPRSTMGAPHQARIVHDASIDKWRREEYAKREKCHHDDHARRLITRLNSAEVDQLSA